MPTKKNILFLINPISGIGKKNIIPKCIDKYLDKTKFNHTIDYTQHKKHGFEIASTQKNKYDCIVAIGGDGTVNEIGSALIDSKTVLGIIPTGSGNGLARHLKIPLKIKNALLKINNFNFETIDTATINGIPFLGTCGFGFDAHIAEKFDNFHKRGFLSYIKLIIKEYKNYKPLTYKITVNGTSKNITSILYAVANSSQFGNGFTISPFSITNDGILEHVYLNDFKIKDFLLMGRQFFNGQIHQSKFYNSFNEKDDVLIEVLNQDQVIFHIDGEPMAGSNHFELKIKPQSLNIIC